MYSCILNRPSLTFTCWGDFSQKIEQEEKERLERAKKEQETREREKKEADRKEKTPQDVRVIEFWLVVRINTT